MNYFEFHIGDYDSATAHLSLLEDGIYGRLLRLYYRLEAPLPADTKQVCRLVRVSSKPERDTVSSVLAEFFSLADDGWHNVRADEEIGRLQDKRGKAKASADARWSAHRSQCEGNAKAMRTHSEGNARAPVPTPQTPNPTSEPKVPRARATRRCPDDFDPSPDVLRELGRECPGIDVGRELRKLRDHTFHAARSDWPATFRNWVREAFDRLPRGAAVKSFRESDAERAAARVAEFAPGIAAKPRAANAAEIIEMETINAALRLG